MGRLIASDNLYQRNKAYHPAGWYAFFIFVLCGFLAVAIAPARAEEPRYPSRLWQVWVPKAPGVKPSYLLGTMHLPDREIVNLPPRIERVVDSADSFTMEVKLDSQAYKAFSSLSALTGSETLSDLVGDSTFDEVVSLLKPRGMSRYGLERMKPWVVGLMLNYPPPSLDPILDHMLQMRFMRAGKPVHQLETAEEQIQIFNKLSMPDQIRFLRYSLEQQKHFDDYLTAMKQHYISDDLDALQAQAAEQMTDVDEDYLSDIYQELIDRRNLRMVDRMRARLHEGNALIAVGALHLTGDYGIIEILRQLDYSVVPVMPVSGSAR